MVQAILRLLKLLLEGCAIRAAIRCHLFANLSGLCFQGLASCRGVTCGQGRARLFCEAQEFSVLQDTAVQPRHLRFELERILVLVPVGNNCNKCSEGCNCTEAKNTDNQPEAPFG